MKKIFNKDKIVSVLVALYFSIGTVYQVGMEGFFSYIILILFLTIILSLIFYYIIKKLKSKDIILNEKDKVSKKEIINYFLLILFVMMITFITFYPGGISYDTINQWNQAITNSYNDWHPVLHTIIFYKIPSLFIAKPFASLLFQGLFISLILTYMSYNLRHIGFNKKTIYFLLALILLNPTTIRMSMIAWKDIAYSYMLLVITLFLIQIVNSKGKWLLENKNLIFLGMVSLLMIMFRHNGIICFLAMMGTLFLLYNQRKKVILITILVIASKLIINGPIYNLLSIETHQAPFAEAMGVPLNQIAYIIVNDGNITEEQYDFFENFGDIEIWKNNFVIKNFNSIKWTDGAANMDYINEHPKEFLMFYLSLINQNKTMALTSYYHVSSVIWSLEYFLYQGAAKNENIYNDSNSLVIDISNFLYDEFNNYEKWVSTSGTGQLLFSYGGSLFIIIFSMFLIAAKGKFYIRKYLPYIVVLSNTLAIALLITGEETRFVYSNIICAFPLLFYGLSNINKQAEDDKEPTLLYNLFLEKTKNSLIQFFRYLFVGGFAAVVNIGALFIFTNIFKIYYIISNIMGFTIALTFNYWLSTLFIFNTDKVKDKKKEFMMYAFIGIIGLGIDTLLMFIFTSAFGIYYMLSKIISTLITLVWNFIARKIMYSKEGQKNEKK